MDRDQVICPCLDVTAGQIMDAYEDGAVTVDAIKDAVSYTHLTLPTIRLV